MVCSCPFCPLVATDLQVCDIKVKLPKRNTHFSTEVVLDDTLPDSIKHNIIRVTLYFKNILELKIGCGKTIDETEYYCCVERYKKDEFKICFHSKINKN